MSQTSPMTSIATTTPVTVAAPAVALEVNLKGKASPEVESKVREYFKDIPIMIEVARCESTFTQFDKDGSVHRGVVNDADVGVMQVNEHYHLNTALKKGIDIHTLEGNLQYARDLYQKEGTVPWNSSSPCWGKYSGIAKK